MKLGSLAERTNDSSLFTNRWVGLVVLLLTVGSARAQEAFVLDELQAERVVVAPGGYFPPLV